MKVLIQKSTSGEFPSVNFYQADKGFELLGWERDYFCYDEKKKEFYYENDGMPVLFDKETVVVGGIPIINAVYEILGVTNPYLEDYPPELDKYFGREIKMCSMGSVRKMVQFAEETQTPCEIFIKPTARNRKQFTGYIVRKFSDLVSTASIPHSERIWCSNLIKDIRSEYRVFIHHGKVVGVFRYKGCPYTAPNEYTIDRMVEAWKSKPVACVIDVGVAHTRPWQDYETLLIEANDANALGCYHLGASTYAKMLANRWVEVMGLELFYADHEV